MDQPTNGASRVIAAPPARVFAAMTDAAAIERWQAPGEMTGTVHRFDPRVGGGYEMSLFYPESDGDSVGKSGGREDRFAVRFVDLTPPSRIVQTVVFDSIDPAFGGEMTMTISLAEADGGTATEVTISYDGVPDGIRPEDNAAGTRQSLEKLAAYVEGTMNTSPLL